MTTSSFYTDGETYDTAVVTSNDQPGSTTPSQAPSSFYPEGNVYDALAEESTTVATIQALATAAQNSANSAASHDTSATAHDASAAIHDTNSATSAAAALVSENNAAASEASAASHDTSAAAHDTSAAAHDASSATHDSNAAASATTATNAATTAITQAGISTAQATNSATSATNAQTSETNAAASATSASSSASSAASAATTAVTTAITNLVNGSPTTLDTLNELASALGDDPNFATTMATQLGLKAPLASPVFTGNPQGPTPVSTDNSTSFATTAFVNGILAAYETTAALVTTLASYVTSSSLVTTLASYATLASPAFTGSPTAPTAANGTNTNQLATTAYVLANGGSGGGVVGEVLLVATTRAPLNTLKADGSAQSRTTYSGLFAALVFSGTVTFTASSASIAWANHGMSAGDKVKFFGTSLPSNVGAGTHGYNVGTEYVVLATGLTANSFEIATTAGGTAIVAATAGSGTITAVNAPWGDGDGSTTFNLPKISGDFIRAWDNGAGIDVNRVFGAEQLDAMQGHVHQATTISENFSNGSASGQDGGNTGLQLLQSYVTTGDPLGDGTNGTPRIAAETRPRNQTLLAVVRYQ